MATLLVVFASGVLVGRVLPPRGRQREGKRKREQLPSGAGAGVAEPEASTLAAAASASEAAALTPSPPARSPSQQPQRRRPWRRMLSLLSNGGGGGASVSASRASSGAVSYGSVAADASAVASPPAAAAAAKKPTSPGAPATPPPRDAHFAAAMNGHAPADVAAAALPSPPPPPPPLSLPTPRAIEAAASIEHPTHTWYVTEHDLEFFRARAEQDAPVAGAGGWTHMMDREAAGSFRYSAWRRALPSGLTEYRSLTLVPDVSPLEYLDFSLDDSCRCRWEGFMVSAEVLEAGDQRQRQQVVRWIRSFPFGFITDRQYVIARALFSVTPDGIVHAGLPPRHTIRRHGHHHQNDHAGGGGGGCESVLPVCDLYCITKSIDHPGEHDGVRGKVLQIPEYYSMFRCRTVACPWGGPRPAVEVLLLHSEDMRIPERLARMAISLGMSKFVHTMAAAVPPFIRERRSRCAPTQPDPLAYGHHHHVYGLAAPREVQVAAAAEASAATPPAAATAVPPATPAAAATPRVPPATPATPGTEDAVAGAGAGPAATATPGTAGARALWRPELPAQRSAFAAGQPQPQPQPQPQCVGGYGSGSRFSLAQVTVGPGTGGDTEAGAAERPVEDGGGGVAWIDPWVSYMGRAMTSTGLWRRQDLPQVSSAWGTTAGGQGGGGKGPGGRRLGTLLRRAALAGAALLLLRRWHAGRSGGGRGRQRRSAAVAAEPQAGEQAALAGVGLGKE